jgi:hypothetical protein
MAVPETELERLVVRIVGDSQPYVKSLKDAEAATQKFRPAADQLGKTVREVNTAHGEHGKALERSGKALAANVGLGERFVGSLNPLHVALAAGAAGLGYFAAKLLDLEVVAGSVKRGVDEFAESLKNTRVVSAVRSFIGVDAMVELEKAKELAKELDERLKAVRARRATEEVGEIRADVIGLPAQRAALKALADARSLAVSGTPPEDRPAALEAFMVAAKAVKDVEREIARTGATRVHDLERERDILGMTAREVEQYDLLLGGVDRKTRTRVDDLQRELEARRSIANVFLAGIAAAQAAREAVQPLLERAKAITQEFRTPLEVFTDTMAELNKMLAAGAISQATYARAAEAARVALRGQWQEVQRVDAALAGSAEAETRVAAFRDRLAFQGIDVVQSPHVVVGGGPVPDRDPLLLQQILLLKAIEAHLAIQNRKAPLTIKAAGLGGP